MDQPNETATTLLLGGSSTSAGGARVRGDNGALESSCMWAFPISGAVITSFTVSNLKVEPDVMATSLLLAGPNASVVDNNSSGHDDIYADDLEIFPIRSEEAGAPTISAVAKGKARAVVDDYDLEEGEVDERGIYASKGDGEAEDEFEFEVGPPDSDQWE